MKPSKKDIENAFKNFELDFKGMYSWIDIDIYEDNYGVYRIVLSDDSFLDDKSKHETIGRMLYDNLYNKGIFNLIFGYEED